MIRTIARLIFGWRKPRAVATPRVEVETAADAQPSLEWVPTKALFMEIASRYDAAALVLCSKTRQDPDWYSTNVISSGLSDVPASLRKAAEMMSSPQARPITDDDL